MRKRGLSKGGFLFICCLIVAAIYDGVYRLVTGHFPAHWDYEIWGFIAVSILVDAQQYFEDIKGNTEELRERVEVLTRKVDSLEDILQCRLDALTEQPKRVFRESNAIEAGLRRLDSIEREIRSKE